MAEYFHPRTSINASTGNWVALPTRTGTGISDPMRRVCLRSSVAMEAGWCTAGQATRDAGTMLSSGSGMGFHLDLGVVNYDRITVRSQGSSGDLYILTFSATDDGPMGF